MGLLFLITVPGVAFAESTTAFTINGKPVPLVVATVNGTELRSDLLKREMIAYQLMANRQGENIETEDEEKIARGLMMEAIDDELVYQQGLKQNISIDSATIDRELNHIQSQFPDKKLFLAALAAQRLTFDVLKKNIKKNITLPASVWLLPWSLLGPACQIYGGLVVRIGTAGVLHLNVHKIKTATF